MKAVKRINEITDLMKERRMDILIIGTSSDLEYLTGLSSMVCERFKALFITKDKGYFFICPQLYYEETRQVLGEDATIFVWQDSEGFLKAIEEAGKDYFFLEGTTIGINDAIRGIDMLAIKAKVAVSFVDGSSLMEEIRQIKDPEEAALLKKSSEIADEVAREIMTYIKPGLTEGDIARRIKALFLEKGAEDIAFEPIVASGPNSSMPHYNGYSRRIQQQDIIVLDFGGRYQGYCSDMSRTVFIGEPTDKQRSVYEIVLRANLAAEELVKEGIKASEVDKRARDIIKEAGYGEHFLNRTGHGIGTAIHEAPYIKENNDTLLQEGMAFSVEPGIYIAGEFGIRIEDIVLVENGKGSILNQYAKEMQCISANI